MTTRRGFFGILGGAAVGGKKAVTEVAASLASGLESLNPVEAGSIPYSGGRFFGPSPEGSNSRSIGVEALRIIGIPEWLREEWRSEIGDVTRFDPDIAALRSLSLSAKINLQMDRNLARYEEDFWKRGTDKVKRDLWKKAHGDIGWW